MLIPLFHESSIRQISQLLVFEYFAEYSDSAQDSSISSSIALILFTPLTSSADSSCTSLVIY